MIRLMSFQSDYVLSRPIDIWVPPGYDSEPDSRYPVLYMHDGQNCFRDADSAFGTAWKVQDTLTALIRDGSARPAIIVGIWSTELRTREYLPDRPFATLSPEARPIVLVGQGLPLGENYLRFLVTELKPFIDTTQRTLTGRDDTFIMGSSRGGLISLYALCEYPEVFGGAGCLSTHWPAVDGLILPYLRARLPAPANHRLYFDYGTETLDALYAPHQALVDRVLSAAGYDDCHWLRQSFPDANHTEAAWAERVHLPLQFLLGN